MSNPWGGVGAWALDAERAEAEEREHAAAADAAAATVLAGQPAQSFPSLKEAAAAKPKKKKGITVSLSQFVAPTASAAAPSARRLTHNEMLRLPTGPKERSAEELEQGRLGGGFRSYGGSRGGGDGGGRRPYGGFDDDSRERPPPRSSDLDLPSRADEVDNWGAGKRSFAPMDSARHDRDRDRYGSLGGGGGAGGGGGFSKADEVDNWSTSKKPLPSRYPSFGSGFRDSPSLPTESDRWVRGAPVPTNDERPRLVLDRPKREPAPAPAPAPTPAPAPVPAPAPAQGDSARTTRPSPFGAARPREEILKEKGVDWMKMESDLEVKKTSRPTSSHSSRPSSSQSNRPGSPGSQAGAAAAEVAVKPRPKVNPFGDAKPREVRLQEQGIDWKKLDLVLEHRRVNRPDTEEEKLLKEEINHLKALAKESEGNVSAEAAQMSAEELNSLREKILQKETELEQLIRQLDDKVRFRQKPSTDIRPGSGSGRIGMPLDRPPSQSGRSEESRSMEFMDRPRSRGGVGDMWSHPMDDRRGFQGSRDRGFLGDRDMDRSKSRPGW